MYSFASLARVHGDVPASGSLKQQNEDFVVDELMPVQPSGAGEHLWLQIRKAGCNTDWLAGELSRLAGVRPMAVSYAGLKDRHAVTTQWFSIHLPGAEDPDLSSLDSGDIQLLQAVRHDRKLKRGTLAGNRFRIRVRNLSGSGAHIEQRLEHVSLRGVPNYFGEQRFGHNMGNLGRAEAMFSGDLKRPKKSQRSLYLSAARSWIFNRLLSERIRQDNWNRRIDGDVFQLAGKSACFADDGSEDIQHRLDSLAIHPTGPLWGREPSMAQGSCLQLERDIAGQHESLSQGLEAAGLKQERRALRLAVEGLGWAFENDQTLVLWFDLPAGAYATMVLREIIKPHEAR